MCYSSGAWPRYILIILFLPRLLPDPPFPGGDGGESEFFSYRASPLAPRLLRRTLSVQNNIRSIYMSTSSSGLFPLTVIAEQSDDNGDHGQGFAKHAGG